MKSINCQSLSPNPPFTHSFHSHHSKCIPSVSSYLPLPALARFGSREVLVKVGLGKSADHGPVASLLGRQVSGPAPDLWVPRGPL